MPRLLGKLAALLFFTHFTGYARPVSKPHPIRASFYAPKFEGRLMANGHRFHGARLSAASRTFPLGTVVRVTNTHTGKSIVVTITDRGPWVLKFGIDLSQEAFRELGLSRRAGWGWVTVNRESR